MVIGHHTAAALNKLIYNWFISHFILRVNFDWYLRVTTMRYHKTWTRTFCCSSQMWRTWHQHGYVRF